MSDFDPAGPNGTNWHPGLRESYIFDRNTIHEIRRAASQGIYDIRGFGAKRKLPHFDAPRNSRSSKCGSLRFAPKPRMS